MSWTAWNEATTHYLQHTTVKRPTATREKWSETCQKDAQHPLDESGEEPGDRVRDDGALDTMVVLVTAHSQLSCNQILLFEEEEVVELEILVSDEGGPTVVDSLNNNIAAFFLLILR